MKKEVLDEIEEINKAIKRKNLTIFCGAGISRNSGVPVVKPLIENILGQLGIPESVYNKFLEIPFEMVLQTLMGSSRDVTDTIFNVYALGKPNTAHLFLAALLQADDVRTIVTTNFDSLIERALNQSTSGYRILYREDDFETGPLDDGQKRLIKIHGSIQDKASMVTTIERIARRNLSAKRRNVVRRVFANGWEAEEAVLILGYSCSDVFDITEYIESVTSAKKRIYFVQHFEGEERVESIVVLNAKNPFSQYPGKRIFCDTDKFIKQLWKKSIPRPYHEVKYASNDQWRHLIHDWVVLNDNYTKAGIIGELFFVVNEYQTAIKYYESMLASCRLHNDWLNEGTCAGNIGLAYDRLGDSLKAIDYYEQAVKTAKKIKDKKGEAVQYGNLGNAYMALNFIYKDYSLALRCFKKALRAAIAIKDRYEEGNWRGSIGDVYIHRKEDFRGIRHLRKALDIAREIGDKKGELSRLGNMGGAYSHLGEFEKAIDYYEQALHIARGLGEDAAIVIALNNIENVKRKMKG